MYQAIPSLVRNSTKLTEAEIISVIIGVNENEVISMRRKSNVNNRNEGRKEAYRICTSCHGLYLL